ncbi:RNA polymerase sigma factor [Candidatus Contubernalis alkaliaceticus]|uniref:RNA polymerase sigma factor n=1 Tax=Candidatus Contubernalis alkaliaceticus TaxID=338645 RepID=UPI001F4BD756|nr:RNA polymerase sigma factor [Candidatus Contubernalis alkalaceticus]UNC93447.1 RNA polymerase sigma factor [Candidatus Contubernalis alkalaceticus]
MIPPGVSGNFEELFKDLWPEVYRFVYYKVQNREEAEELTQDTFKRVYPKLIDNQVQPEKIRAYVFQAARNMMKDLWRKRARHPRVVNLEEVQESRWSDAGMENESEDKMVIIEAMKELTEDYRHVLVWRVVEGYSVQEVAEKMERSPGAVRSLQFRAAQSLKQILEERGYFRG